MTNNWITVSERLPDEYGYYLVTNVSNKNFPDMKRVFIALWNDENIENISFFKGRNGTKLSNITAWQPLPEPYKE